MRMSHMFGNDGGFSIGKFAAPAFAKQVQMGCELHKGEEEDIDPVTLSCRKCKKKNRSAGRMGDAALGDSFTDAAKSVFEGLLSVVASAVSVVPPQLVGVYSARLQACQAMVAGNPDTGTYVAAGECLRQLAKDIQNGTGAQVTLPPPVAQPQSTFPIVPVAIAAVLGIGLIFFLTRGN